MGRSYHEIYPDSALPAMWEYYVKPDRLDASTTLTLASLTVLDPCMGSGHFLREAFDMFVAMYREHFHTLSATEIADRILSHHLHGIDLDPRAAQLSALTLYLRAWELVRDGLRKERKPGPGTYTPPAMSLATTPTSLNEGVLQRHLLRHPQDMQLKPLLEGIFSGLEQADILGSLIRPKEYLDNAIAELQRPHTIRMDFDPEEAELRRTITAMANHDPVGLRQMLLDRVADSFKSEAGNTDDVSAALFGREAEQGVRLLQLLDRRYAVVVTNPPYMGSKNMDVPLKKYVEKYFLSGKRDLYAAFILRCIELCRPVGRVAMVTQQSWMFFKSYIDLRALSEESAVKDPKKRKFMGLLRETSIEILAHLGSNAFEEISGEVVQSVMFTLSNCSPSKEHAISAFRLVGLANALEKDARLRLKGSENVLRVTNSSLLDIIDTPIVYWVPPNILKILVSFSKVRDVADVRRGIGCSELLRFVRRFHEVDLYKQQHLWIPYAHGGGYRKWDGLIETVVDWSYNGARLKLSRSIIPSEYRYFSEGLTFTDFAQGALSTRILNSNCVFSDSGPGIFPFLETDNKWLLLGLLNSRFSSYILRTTSPSALHFRTGYVENIPIPQNALSNLNLLAKTCKILKSLVTEVTIKELDFQVGKVLEFDPWPTLLTFEAMLEKVVFGAFGINDLESSTVIDETGILSGWYPLVSGYDTLPPLPVNLDLPPLPQELLDYLTTHKRINPGDKELARIKANLQNLFEAGSGAKNVEQEETDKLTEGYESEEEIALGAHIPIPTETFLEELSVKMQLHPISIYWLLEELKAEGARCKPEELRLLEDRLSVLILRLLGHRWPKQLEADELVPSWASSDGIIPLVAGTSEATLVEQVRAQLRTEEGELGVQQTEALLTELTGLSLEEWLQRKFFSRHISQFKYRPIAWHLASIPVNNGQKKRGWSQRGPAFECLLYYHACSGDALARIRTQYVEPLLRAERQKMEDAYLFKNETISVLANERIQELEAFVEKLRFIEEQGFACPELEKFMTLEPLDRWSGDGYLAPANRDELLRNEQAWHVDSNDGVRVNIAPLQLAGVLASDVLKPADAKKALADRARWRADERRWVRDGKLPRCGWMDERVPESPRWTEREPERVAEQIKLEQKRQTLQGRRAEEVEL